MVQLFGYKESWAHVGPADLSVNLKGDIWDLPKPVAKPICASGRTTHFFPPKSLLSCVEKEEKNPTVSLEVDGVSGQSCCGDLVLITGLFLQSAEHKRAPRKY